MIPTNKKIAILHPFIKERGGAIKMMIYLSSFLKNKKNDINFFCFSYNKENFKDIEINFKINSFFEKGFLKIFSLFLIAYKIRKSDYIVIGNSPMHFAGVISKILFLSKAKIIWWNHHYPWYYNKDTKTIKLKRFLEKKILEKIDIIVANSIFLKKELEKIFNRQIYLLNPVLDKEFILYKGKREVDKLDNILFSYSRWVKGKNLELNFETYDYLKTKINNLILVIAGEGEELKYYKNKYKNDKNIIFLGRINKKQIISNLEKTKVFLFSSIIDSFGIVVIEAMSVGVPVVSFNSPGVKEIISNKENSFITSSKDNFFEKTYKLLIDNSLNKKISNSAKKITISYNEENFSESLDQIFLNLKN